MIFTAFLVYTGFGLIHFFIMLFVFRLQHVIYGREVGKTKVNGKEYRVFEKDPIMLQIITTIVFIFVWPLFVHYMTRGSKK
jgi:p-aminobenzoyl-glutamate transporter AbgT